MTTIFITGDRSLPTSIAYKLAQTAIVKAMIDNQEDLQSLRFATGDAINGIERAVRYILPEQFLTVIKRDKTPEGYINWEKGAIDAAKVADKAVVLHMKPEESRATKPVLAHFDEVEMPLTALNAPDTAPVDDAKVELSKEEASEFDALVAGLDFGTDEKKSE